MPPKSMYKPKRKPKVHVAAGTIDDPIVLTDDPKPAKWTSKGNTKGLSYTRNRSSLQSSGLAALRGDAAYNRLVSMQYLDLQVTEYLILNNKENIWPLLREQSLWAVDQLCRRQLECHEQARLAEEEACAATESENENPRTDSNGTPENDPNEQAQLSEWLTEIDECEVLKQKYKAWLNHPKNTQVQDHLDFLRAFRRDMPGHLSLLKEHERCNKTDHRDGPVHRIRELIRYKAGLYSV